MIDHTLRKSKNALGVDQMAYKIIIITNLRKQVKEYP